MVTYQPICETPIIGIVHSKIPTDYTL